LNNLTGKNATKAVIGSAYLNGRRSDKVVITTLPFKTITPACILLLCSKIDIDDYLLES
jgi:hypothetical protein